jgi:hypothetical protein
MLFLFSLAIVFSSALACSLLPFGVSDASLDLSHLGEQFPHGLQLQNEHLLSLGQLLHGGT